MLYVHVLLSLSRSCPLPLPLLVYALCLWSSVSDPQTSVPPIPSLLLPLLHVTPPLPYECGPITHPPTLAHALSDDQGSVYASYRLGCSSLSTAPHVYFSRVPPGVFYRNEIIKGAVGAAPCVNSASGPTMSRRFCHYI